MEGVRKAVGSLGQIHLAPGQTKEVHVPVAAACLEEAGERIIIISLLLAKDYRWAQHGHEIAWEQFEISQYHDRPQPNRNWGLPSLNFCSENFIVTGEEFSVTVNRKKGALSSFVYQGREYIAQALVPNTWRTPNDNQMRNNYLEKYATWREAVNQLRVVDISPTAEEDRVSLRFCTQLPGLARYEMRIAGDGLIEITVKFHPVSDSIPPMPRLGLRLGLARVFNRVVWYGRGPHETHCDRKLGAKIGLNESSLGELHHPYVRPQLNGNRTDVRWVKLHDGNQCAGRCSKVTIEAGARAQEMPDNSKWAVFDGLTPKAQWFSKASIEGGAGCRACLGLNFS